MLRSRNHDKKGSRGAAALELTLALPVLLTVAFGLIEFGRAFDLKQRLVSVASEAARVGSQASCPRATTAEVLAAAHATLISAGLLPSLASFSLENTGGTSGTDMIVNVSYNAGFPMLSRFVQLASTSDGNVAINVRIAAENE